MGNVTRAMSLSGMMAVQSLTLDMACKHTKFDDVPEIF